MKNIEEPWYGVKCLFLHKDLRRRNGQNNYEERVILVKADSFDDAIQIAEMEAKEYCQDLGEEVEFLNFSSAFHICESVIEDKTEIYSLITKSELSQEDYINTYYDTREN